MRQANRWWLIRALILLMTISGCDTSRPPVKPTLSDNARFMDIWGTYTHCHQSDDLDEMRVDAQRLSRAADTISYPAAPMLPESIEPVTSEPAVRLSVDPSAMAAACALRTGQVAQDTGRRNIAREMFLTIITNFPQSPYRYYVVQARLGLDRLNAMSPAPSSSHIRPGGPKTRGSNVT